MFNSQTIDVDGYKVMIYTAGEGDNTLLLLHGGPGVPCNYLRDSHHLYADKGYKVVTWDQLGCGESDKPDDDSLWTIERFVEEVETVRQALNLTNIHLLGQSWGGVLGLEYCFRYQKHIQTFIAANTSFCLPLMQRGFERIKLALGQDTVRMMAKREAQKTTDHPEYQAAASLLLHRHICRAEKWSESLQYSLNNIATNVLSKVFGNHLFNCTGSIRHYDKIHELHKIKVPTLILHGEWDYIIPECATLAHDHLSNSEFVLLNDCSHEPFDEDPDQYHAALLNFLKRHNKS